MVDMKDSAFQISGKSRISFQPLTSKPHYSQVYLSNVSLPAIITPSYQPCTHLSTSHLPSHYLYFSDHAQMLPLPLEKVTP